MHHGKAARPLVAGHHVTHDVVAHVTDMNVPAGIREHLQDVVFGLVAAGHVSDAKAAALGPGTLPSWLGLLEVKARRLGRDSHALVHDGMYRARSTGLQVVRCGPSGLSRQLQDLADLRRPVDATWIARHPWRAHCLLSHADKRVAADLYCRQAARHAKAGNE